MNSELKIVKLADPTTVSFFLRFAGVLMHRLGLVLCILHVDLTLEPASYVSSVTSISEAGGLRASSSNLFSKRFSDAGIMSATILLTALGEAGAFPPPVFLLIKFLFRLDFQALPIPLYCFHVALVPIWISGVEGFSQFFPQDVFFLFKLALTYALFSISGYCFPSSARRSFSSSLKLPFRDLEAISSSGLFVSVISLKLF